ncbi:MAG: IS3 family transposase [Limnohabitans sp.]|uniref:IS3 family transposase n=1 Tax=Limnohabitans sp. TaxID=1907725 RepID=UPI00391B94ED
MYNTRAEIKSEIFDYIESFYCQVRRHKHLDQLSPYEFERQRQTVLSKLYRDLGECLCPGWRNECGHVAKPHNA